MRLLRPIFAVALAALLSLCSRAQDAVLVLLPGPRIAVEAGNGVTGFGGDGAIAAAAEFAAPSAMAQDAQGNLYIADTRNHRIRRIDVAGIITTVAGTGVQGFGGDGGPATAAQLDSPSGVAIATDGTLYIADTHNHRIREVNAGGTIRTIAGSTSGFSGDGDAAVFAQLAAPTGLAIGLSGDLYIADTGNHRVRHIGAGGTIATVAGDGAQGTSPYGHQASAMHLNAPSAISVRPDGSVLIADRGNDRVLLLQTDGSLSALDTASLSLRRPSAVATSSSGDTFIADSGNFRIAQLSINGAGSALGSGVQGKLDRDVSPVRTPVGTTSSVIAGSTAHFMALDRDNSQVVQVSLPELTFPDTVVSATSTTRSLQLSNGGSGSIIVTGITLPPLFTSASTTLCGAPPFQLAPGASCRFDLAFTPQTVGAITAMLQVDVQHAPPQRVLLAATGLRTGTQLASSTSLQTSGSLSYAGVPLALTAAVIGGSSSLATGSVSFIDGDGELGSSRLNGSAQATLSTSALTTGAHMLTARYTGDAQYLGSRSTSIVVTVANPPDFTLGTPSGTRVVLQRGSAGSLSLMLQPVSGVLNRVVTVLVDGLPAGSAINVTPVPVTLAGDPVPVSIAVKLPVSVAANRIRAPFAACVLPLLLFAFRSRNPARKLLMLACSVLPLALQGCGGGYLSNGSVTAQSAGSTYAVSVTASCPGVTGATLTHTATFTVEVQP